MSNAATWVALVTAVATALGGVIAWRKMPVEVKHQKVTTDLLVSGEARALLRELREEREYMKGQLEKLRMENIEIRVALATAQTHIAKLEAWVLSQGGVLEEILG